MAESLRSRLRLLVTFQGVRLDANTAGASAGESRTGSGQANWDIFHCKVSRHWLHFCNYVVVCYRRRTFSFLFFLHSKNRKCL